MDNRESSTQASETPQNASTVDSTKDRVEHSLSLLLRHSSQIEAFFSVDLQRTRGTLIPTVTIINTVDASEEQEQKLKGALWAIAEVYRELYAERASRPEAADSVPAGNDNQGADQVTPNPAVPQ